MFARFCHFVALLFSLFALWRTTFGSPPEEDPFLWVVGLFLSVFYLFVVFTIHLLKAKGVPFRQKGSRYDPHGHLRAADATDHISNNDMNP